MSTKVLLISPYSMNYYGGVQNQLSLIKKYASSQELDIKILSPDSNDFDIGEIFKFRFNGSVAPIKLFPRRKIVKKALLWADVIHIHEPFIPVFFWRIPINNKTILSHHADLSPMLQYVQKMLLYNEKQSSAVTAVSNVARKSISSKIAVGIIPNAIPVLKNEYKNNGNTKFLFIGRDEKRKNFDLYKEYAETKINKNSIFQAIVNRDKFSKNIITHVNPDNEQKHQILLDSDIYLAVNSRGESFGITLIEAISYGCVVVCSDIPAFTELLGNTGIYFKNKSLESLSETIDILLKSNIEDIHRKQLVHINRYSIEKVMECWISLYFKI